ncbi:MAG: hypothetical protein WAK00_12610 [Microbacterium sp.]|uniref:MarR family winged helix-turn-helix transcriptional regulator n=1 Tax=Microbacterium sp. TaxID=51671 RepID=UPI003BB04515
MNTPDTQNLDNSSRPFGYWLKAADRLMAADFATAFESDGASRRDWRMLNIIDGSVSSRRPLSEQKLHRLIERGWVAPEGDGWTLTDDGRAAKERLGAVVDGIRARVTDAVTDEDMATTLASLEKIARAFGWDENAELPRGRGRRFGFGPRGFGRHGFGRQGFGPREFGHHGFGGHADCGPHAEREHGHGHHEGHPGHEHGDHRGHLRGPGRAGFAHVAQGAYERGFDAGFTRGRDA